MAQTNPPGARHRGAPVTFSSLARATAGLPAAYRCRVFGSLPSALQDEAWRGLRVECDQRNQAANRAAAELTRREVTA